MNKFDFQDDELLRQFSERDPIALQVMVETYYPILCRFAERFLPDASLAKDIVQETFIKLWQYEGKFSNLRGLKSFLFTITKNGCLNLQRGRAREERKHKSGAVFQLDTESVFDEVSRLEHLARIYALVRQFPPKMQEVFLLTYEQGLSVEEIAEKLQVSIRTVRNQKYRSLLILRRHFGNSRGALLFLLSYLVK